MISNNWQPRHLRRDYFWAMHRRWTRNRFWPSQHHFWYLVQCWPSSFWFGIGESFIRRNVLDPLCRLDLCGGEFHGDAADHRVGVAPEAMRSAVTSPSEEEKADGCSSKLESAIQLFSPLFEIATQAIALAILVIYASLFGRSSFG